MCERVTCDKCGKPGWEGCGGHIETALAGVPIEDRCKCTRTPTKRCSDEVVQAVGRAVGFPDWFGPL